MNCTNLIDLDDASKFLVLDQFLKYTTKKFRSDILTNVAYKKDLMVDLEKSSSLLLHSADINSGVELLMKIAEKYNLFYLFGISYRIWLRNHLMLYLKFLYSDESICKIEFCNRYKSENYNGLKVVAKRDIKTAANCFSRMLSQRELINYIK